MAAITPGPAQVASATVAWAASSWQLPQESFSNSEIAYKFILSFVKLFTSLYWNLHKEIISILIKE